MRASAASTEGEERRAINAGDDRRRASNRICGSGSGGACMAKGIRVQCFHREAIRSAYTKIGCWPRTSSILNTEGVISIIR